MGGGDAEWWARAAWTFPDGAGAVEGIIVNEGDREVGTVCLFIDASVARLCRVLGINRSTYYAWLASRRRRRSPRPRVAPHLPSGCM
jgi:hypothetical protein